MHNQIFSELSSLERKFELFLSEQKSLNDEITRLKEENQQLKSVISSKEQALDNFHNKAKISKLVDKIGTDENGAGEIRKTIDEYIREIDRCIAHLSR